MSLKYLILFLFFSQVLSAQKKSEPVKIAEATEQQWFSGVRGGGTGTNYVVKLYIETAEKIEFKNMWIGDVNVPFNLEYFKLKPPAKLNPGDSLLLVYRRINQKSQDNASAKRLPIQYNGSALIEYLQGKRARYLIVKSFTKKAPLLGQ